MLLLSSGDYRVLSAEEQSARLEQYIAEAWFGPGPVDTIDTIRWIQRTRVHAAKVGMSVGDLMIGLLREAKMLHAAGQAVHPVIQPASGRLIEAVPVEDIPAEAVPAEAVPAEAVPAEAVPVSAPDIAPPPVPSPAPDSPQRRPKRVK